MKPPTPPDANTSNFEKLAYFKAMQIYTDMQRAKNEAYYENRIEKLNRNIAIVLILLAAVCTALVFLFLNR